MEKKTTKKKVATSKKNCKSTFAQPTLLQTIERVVTLSEDSMMSDEFMLRAAPDLRFLADSFGITERQALLFCVCMEKGPRCVDFDDLANYLGMNKIRILNYASDIDALIRRRLLRYRDAKEENSFDVPNIVIKHLKHNEVYELPRRTNLDCAELFELLNLWFNDLSNDAISPKELLTEVMQLLDENKHLVFVRKLKELNLTKSNQLLLVMFCHFLINENDEDIRFGQIESIYESQPLFSRERSKLRSGEHELIKKSLIEHLCEDGIANPNRYKMSDKAKRILLAELKVSIVNDMPADILKANTLTEKKMFYSDCNEKQVDELASFLQPEKYGQIRKRMQEYGFHNGFTCLFYGGPGTGKTETVYQLARQTGRDIMVVDVPRIKSKWVGESEKNIKALFDRYREMANKAAADASEREEVQNDLKKTPILLFNEADAIIGIRKEGAQSAVDKMENTIQNIILQEMEALDGIMIATTNLANNLDSAFERRFLYKIKFDSPDVNVRKKLWKNMISDLSEADSATLAETYELSGGQIENVARKYAINGILHGNQAAPLAMLRDYCDNERLNSKRDMRRIGF